MYSKKDDMLRIPGSGGHLIGSWDLCKHSKNHPELQSVRFQNLPKLNKAKRDHLDSCYTSEQLVESRTSGETFLVKHYRKTAKIRGRPKVEFSEEDPRYTLFQPMVLGSSTLESTFSFKTF